MGENFDLLVWRAGKVDRDGYILTAKALKELADGLIPGVEISCNFDFHTVVGHIVQPWIDGDDLYVTVTISDPEAIKALHEGGTALRPGFQIERQRYRAHETIVEGISMSYVSLMSTPLPLPGDQCEDS